MSYADQIRVEPSAYKMRSLIADGIEENKAIADDAKETADNADTNATEAKEQVEINTTQWSDYKQAMDSDEIERKNSENTRIGNEIARQSNEGLRQDMYADFRGYTNELATVGKISYEIDGGWIGDEDDGTGLNIDGGTL